MKIVSGSTKGIILWWESRRLVYNISVLLSGLFSMLLAYSFLGHAVPMLEFCAFFGVITWGILANVCYTFGWVTELITLPILRHRTRFVGRTIFLVGFVFSIVLTLGTGIYMIFNPPFFGGAG